MQIDDVSLRCREDLISDGFGDCTVSYALRFAIPPTGTYSISYDCQIVLLTSHPDDIISQRKYGTVSGFAIGAYGLASDFGSTVISVRRILGDNPIRVVISEFDCNATRTRLSD